MKNKLLSGYMPGPTFQNKQQSYQDLSPNWPVVLLPRSDAFIDVNFSLPSKEPKFPNEIHFIYVNVCK